MGRRANIFGWSGWEIRFAAFHATLILGLVTAAMLKAEPVIFAAASTRAPLDAAIAASGQDAVVSYGASGTIARQIAQGAPADLFISANPKWMRYLVDEGVVDAKDVHVLVSNRLVVIAPEGADAIALEPGAMGARLARDYFAVADPAIAPVGQYGQEALTDLALWATVAPTLLPTRNTVATVATVVRGEAALGLVYRSDVTGVAGIVVAAEIPARSHSPINYLIAPIAQGSDPEAAHDLIAYLRGEEGLRQFEAFGFAAAGDES